jgi:hypothetical protein
LFSDYLNKDCYKLESTSTDDGLGGYTLTWTAGTSLFKGYTRLLTGSERELDERLGYASTHMFLWESEVLTHLNRVRIDSVDYQINTVIPVFGHHYKASIKRLEVLSY